MALSRVKSWISGEVLTASDLNAEFNSILNNPVSLISPLTGALDFDGVVLTLDAAAATTVVSSAAVSWNFTSGAKTGTPATTGSITNYSAATFTDSATAGSGTATAYVAHGIQRPTLAATNASVTTTDAAVLYIPNNVAAGTNETITNSWTIWVDAGNVRFDDDIYWRSGTSFNGIFSHNISTARTWTFPDETSTVGYQNIPQNSQSAAYTTVLLDAGKHILHPTADNNARTFTIDSNANVAYAVGTAITFINQINTVTISITSDTMTLAGAGSTGSRTLAANGIATAVKVSTTGWVISGTGLT